MGDKRVCVTMKNSVSYIYMKSNIEYNEIKGKLSNFFVQKGEKERSRLLVDSTPSEFGTPSLERDVNLHYAEIGSVRYENQK